jgi:hypothetical protein
MIFSLVPKMIVKWATPSVDTYEGSCHAYFYAAVMYFLQTHGLLCKR